MNGSEISDWDIIVVTYNSASALREVWSNVAQEVRHRVTCVDNSSSDDSVAVAHVLFPRVVEVPNRGLSVSNNIGAAMGTSPYLLFANPDLAPTLESFIRLRAHLDTHGGLASPRLVDALGNPQENARGWPALPTQLSNRLRPGKSELYRWPLQVDRDGPVPWVLGAAIAVKREDLEKVGGWPENFFLYYEDVELCLRAWERGMPVWILGEVHWFHQWARSSRRLLSRTTLRHAQSATRFFRARPKFLVGVPQRLAERLESARVAAGTGNQDCR